MQEKLVYQVGMVAHLLENQYNDQLAVHGLTVAQSKVLFLLVEMVRYHKWNCSNIYI